MGKVVIEEVELFRKVVGQLNKKFIAFDTETTGFSPYKDRIIELGAVLFINNKETEYFNSLVKTDVKNSYQAYKFNKISEEMLENAPLEIDIYLKLVEFLEEVLKRTHDTNYSHYFYGTTNENMTAFIETIKGKYPFLKIAGYEPSVFRELNKQEEQDLIDRINNSNADFVWVALGAPKQEFFCAKLSGKTNALWTAVGGAFNVISGVIPRAPQWMQDHGLEWFYRFLKEPRRLFKRYFITNTKFLYYLKKDKKGR